MFAHAISSTSPTAPRRMKAAGRTSLQQRRRPWRRRQPPVLVLREFGPWLLLDAVVRWPASSAFACASDAPGASRASMLNWRMLRGTSAADRRPTAPTDRCQSTTARAASRRRSKLVRPLMRIGRGRECPGSPPNRDCHSRWLMIAAGGPSGPSSSRVNPRPSAGVNPMTGNRSSRTSAVNTRSGTSPPRCCDCRDRRTPTCAKLRTRADVEILGRRQRLDVGGFRRQLRERHAYRDEAIRLADRETGGTRNRRPGRRSGCWRQLRSAERQTATRRSQVDEQLTKRVAHVLPDRIHVDLFGWCWKPVRVRRRPAVRMRRPVARGVNGMPRRRDPPMMSAWKRAAAMRLPAYRELVASRWPSSVDMTSAA